MVLSTIYLFRKVSLSPDIILCGWLGLKHQLTNYSYGSFCLVLLFLLIAHSPDFMPPPPPFKKNWNHFLCMSVCSSVRVYNIHSVLPELHNHFGPDLIWWCIIMRWCVVQKNWFTIFNVKVTARAYIIKIWLFLLYLLNCWSSCNQTWFDSAAS